MLTATARRIALALMGEYEFCDLREGDEDDDEPDGYAPDFTDSELDRAERDRELINDRIALYSEKYPNSNYSKNKIYATVEWILIVSKLESIDKS